MKIPDEAVEVGAAALCECDGGLWGDLGPEHRAPYISESYAVLSEALPHLEAAIRADTLAKVRERVEAMKIDTDNARFKGEPMNPNAVEAWNITIGVVLSNLTALDKADE
jgi:hypothetical protein